MLYNLFNMTQNYDDMANNLIEQFEDYKQNFINKMTNICQNTFNVTNEKKSDNKMYIYIINVYLKYTSKSYPNYIVMKQSNIIYSAIDDILNSNINQKYRIYDIYEHRGAEDTIDIIKKSENEFEIVYDVGTEGAGNTYRYIISKMNLLYILDEIKKVK